MPEALAPKSFNQLPYSQQADIVRFALEQVPPRGVSSTKRTIEEAELIESSEEYVSDHSEDAAEEDTDRRDTFKCVIDPMLLDEEPISANVEQIPKPMRITTKVSVGSIFILSILRYLLDQCDSRRETEPTQES
jgi:hypothetical protein